MLEGFHLKVSQVVLKAVEPYGFALGGGYALQAHGIIDRLSTDIDSYTQNPDAELFNAAEQAVIEALESNGLQCLLIHSDSWLRALSAIDSNTNTAVTIDLGYDYRENQAVVIAGIGPVLDIEDAITGKVRAFWDRQAARDYLDLNAILATGKWDVKNLYAKLVHVRPEATAPAFTDMLNDADDLAEEYVGYGLSDSDIADLSKRLSIAAKQLTDS